MGWYLQSANTQSSSTYDVGFNCVVFEIDYVWGNDISSSLQGTGGVGGLLYQTIDDVIYIPCYDNNGNVTKYVDANGSVVASCTYHNHYDHKGLRIRKIVKRYANGWWNNHATHTFIFDGGNIVLERIAKADGNNITKEYFWGIDKSGSEQGAGGVGGLLAVSVNGIFSIPCYDHNGNIVTYISETGGIEALYVYDAYGNTIEKSGEKANIHSFGFSTKYHDREVGLIGYQKRFYSPDHGRWLNRDPIEEEGGENLYAFCGNNPIVYIDKFGYDIWVENTTAVYGLHQRVCVTVWEKDDASNYCCNGVRYRKSGKYCISFGVANPNNADSTDSYSGDGGSSDSDSSGNSSTSADEAENRPGKSPFPDGFDGPNKNGDGIVYPDNVDPSIETHTTYSTGNDPCVDFEIFRYMQGLVGQRANYSIIFQNCRAFSNAVYNKYKKGKR